MSPTAIRMSDLHSDVARFLRRQRLLEPREPLWVAVSGGVDSMVLLHLLRDMGHPCTVAHVDHGLRGVESTADRDLVAAYCEREGIPCRVNHVDVKALEAASDHSLQSAARELRYGWFRELLTEHPMPFALAHHADDAVETLLIGLLRGTGARGWAGIPPTQGFFRRPLLHATRQSILLYAALHQVPFREDASNADPKYLRNRIRSEVIPLLEDLRPGALRAMSRSVRMLHDVEAAARALVEQGLADIRAGVDGSLHVPFTRLRAFPAPGLLLNGLLRDRGFHPEVIDRIQEAMDARSTGSRFLSPEWSVSVDREALLITPLVPPARPGDAGRDDGSGRRLDHSR